MSPDPFSLSRTAGALKHVDVVESAVHLVEFDSLDGGPVFAWRLRRGSLPLLVRLGKPDKLACQDEVRRLAANEDWSRGESNT